MGGWPKSKRCRVGVAIFSEASGRHRRGPPTSGGEDHQNVHIFESLAGANEVWIVMPVHLRGDLGMASGDVAGLDRLSRQVNIRAELWHDDAALRLLGYDIKLLLDTFNGIKVALRKIPKDRERYGTYQLFLQPGHANLYTVPNTATISRPKAVGGFDQALVDRRGCQETDHDFVQRLLLALGVAMKPRSDSGLEVQLKAMFGHLELHDAAQGQTYTRSELVGLLKRLSTRGVASFSAGLRGRCLSSQFLLARFKLDFKDPAVLCTDKLEVSAKDTRVEMAIDRLPGTTPNEYRVSVARMGIFETRGVKILEFAVASPQRDHDWCFTAEQVKVCDDIPAYVEQVTKILETARIHDRGDIVPKYRLDDSSIFKLRHHVDIISLKQIVIFPLQNTPFMLEAANVCSWTQDGRLSIKHELALSAPEWHETTYEPGSAVLALMEERKLMELIGGVDSVLQKLEA